MVQYWLKDIALFGNTFADMQIIHFYRWLQSPNSLLYDPAIRRTLQSYMKKLCVLVSASFRHLLFNYIPSMVCCVFLFSHSVDKRIQTSGCSHRLRRHESSNPVHEQDHS